MEGLLHCRQHSIMLRYTTAVCCIITFNYVVLAVNETSTVTKEFDQKDDMNSNWITVTTDFPKQPPGQGCIVEISLVGKGIMDSFLGPCWMGGAYSYNTGDLMIWGDPYRSPITFYNNRPGTLVVISNNVCTQQEYRKKNGQLIITRHVMWQAHCAQILNTIYYYMQGSHQLVSPPPTTYGMAVSTKDGVNKGHFTSSHSRSTVNGQCQKTVVVKGRGIADSITVPCSAIKDPEMVRFRGGMLIGNPLRDEFSMFSEEWGTAVVVSRGQCVLRVYQEEHGFMKITYTNISYDECEAARERMYTKRNELVNVVTGVAEHFKHKVGSLFKG